MNIKNIKIINLSQLLAKDSLNIIEDINVDGIQLLLNDNRRAALLISPATFDEIVEIIDEYKLLLEAVSRIKYMDNSLISMDEVMSELNITREDLDDIDVDLDI